MLYTTSDIIAVYINFFLTFYSWLYVMNVSLAILSAIMIGALMADALLAAFSWLALLCGCSHGGCSHSWRVRGGHSHGWRSRAWRVHGGLLWLARSWYVLS